MIGCKTSPMSGIWSISATAGVTDNGPTTGSCCNGCRSGVCGMATTWVGASVAAKVLRAGADLTSVDVVTGLTGMASLGVRSNSCRAAAIIIRGSGDSTGIVGELPANGLRTSLTMLDIAVVTTAAAACGCGWGFWTVTSAVFGADANVTPLVGPGSSACLALAAGLA